MRPRHSTQASLQLLCIERHCLDLILLTRCPQRRCAGTEPGKKVRNFYHFKPPQPKLNASRLLDESQTGFQVEEKPRISLTARSVQSQEIIEPRRARGYSSNQISAWPFLHLSLTPLHLLHWCHKAAHSAQASATEPGQHTSDPILYSPAYTALVT